MNSAPRDPHGILRAHARRHASTRAHRRQAARRRATIEAEKVGCDDGVTYNGWFGRLLFNWELHGESRPTIADVHTAPTDAQGNPVGWILHAATGYARLMVFTVEDCGGVRAYVGPVSSFHRKFSAGFERLDDESWMQELDTQHPSPPEWTRSFAR